MPGSMHPMPPLEVTPVGNRLLDSLPRADIERLRPHLEALSVGIKHVVYEPDGPITHVYFPTGCVISLVTYMEDGLVRGNGHHRPGRHGGPADLPRVRYHAQPARSGRFPAMH